MKILHVADTHLGYSAYNKLAPNGLNQREMDVYHAFEKFVDYALESKPDLIIHAGDFFDSVRPTNRAIHFALNQLLRLSKARVPFIVISGNHETPKLRETGSVFQIFEHLENIHPIYKGRYEVLSFGDAMIHAVPQCPDGEKLKENIRKISLDDNDKYNILTLHGGTTGIKEFRQWDFNEQVIPTNYLDEEFDYIALGHYHSYAKVTENAFYSGSTEHFSFNEAGEEKGFIELNDGKVKFIPLNARPMIDMDKIDCSTFSPEELTQEIIRRLNEVKPEGKILRLHLQNLPHDVYREIDLEGIRNMASKALHFETRCEFLEENREIQGGRGIGSLIEEWKDYISKVKSKDKERIADLATKYLSEVE